MNNTRRYKILHTLNLGCSFITFREACNDQRHRCDIAWFNSCYKKSVKIPKGQS
jgi:hypothetical protein